MNEISIPDSYIGREQAYVKHQILKTYLQRLFLIIGQHAESTINYIDCFSGPWQAGDKKLSDTSIGISLEQMYTCQSDLSEKFGRAVKFRALYIEKDPNAFQALKGFLDSSPYTTIETCCINGDYTEKIPEIVEWCGSHFSFFFVDPKGWQKVVGARTMEPLLQLHKAEFLINLMYDFINRFVGLEQHAEDMIELFGEIPQFSTELPRERETKLLQLYRNSTIRSYDGRSGYVRIEKPGRDRTLYALVYFTRHPRGLDVFKATAEKMNIVQRRTQAEVKLRHQLERSSTDDLFGDIPFTASNLSDTEANIATAQDFLVNQLNAGPLLIDWECWADFLERTDLYPSDFQAAMRNLVKNGSVINLDADISRRRKNFIKPNWQNKSERWSLT
ncbi:three-Cys-motif partner protein TcmP [uncultured Zhongshania sp.]|uniref:three-Cys-motif partner protein TcmP n=1 Tax=uncultured Zhongshania sp. TaxID=1642288 RepID=UPI0025D97591|nr:three-Cys-motif partner protein TcmP [uncultured Zhongshania sp.]